MKRGDSRAAADVATIAAFEQGVGFGPLPGHVAQESQQQGLVRMKKVLLHLLDSKL
jgi:hypothetical protein